MRRIRMLIRLMPILMLAGCASRTAGLLVDRAQTEFATYQANANAKVQQAEDARLELELHLVRIDIENLFRSGALPADQAAARTIEAVMGKVDAYRARLATWHGVDNSAARIRAELAAVAKYHAAGVTADDLIPSVEQLSQALDARTRTAANPTMEGGGNGAE